MLVSERGVLEQIINTLNDIVAPFINNGRSLCNAILHRSIHLHLPIFHFISPLLLPISHLQFLTFPSITCIVSSSHGIYHVHHLLYTPSHIHYLTFPSITCTISSSHLSHAPSHLPIYHVHHLIFPSITCTISHYNPLICHFHF